MRRYFAGLLLLCGLVACPLMARLPFQEPIFEFDIGGGYRQDALKWSASGPSKNPLVQSKLKWESLQINQVTAGASLVTCDSIYLRFRGDYGWIHNGRATDTDFALQQRTPPNHKKKIVHADAKANRGHVFDLSAGLGYFFAFLDNRASLIPVAGYSHHEQHLVQRDVFVKLDKITGAHGSLPGVNNKYSTRWYGPWAGMDFTLQMTCNLGVFGGAEFHWTRFHARGNWNKRIDFIKDFRQTSRGWGQLYTLGFNYDFCRSWSLCLVGDYKFFKTKRGRDKVFFSQGSVDSRLNRVRWHSYSVMGTLAYIY